MWVYLLMVDNEDGSFVVSIHRNEAVAIAKELKCSMVNKHLHYWIDDHLELED